MIRGRGLAIHFDDQDIRELQIAAKNCLLMLLLHAFINFEEDFEGSRLSSFFSLQ
jgi:hypothetical protein